MNSRSSCEDDEDSSPLASDGDDKDEDDGDGKGSLRWYHLCSIIVFFYVTWGEISSARLQYLGGGERGLPCAQGQIHLL